MSSMADKTPEQEPSIEEILASIRQIISDDDEKDSGSEDAAPAAEPAAETKTPEVKAAPAEPKPAPEPKQEDVLELTEAEAIPAEPAPAPKPEPIEIDMQDSEPEEEMSIDDIFAKEEPAMPQASADDSILSNTTRQAAVASMAKLAGNMPINRSSHTAGSVTLEDIVREILNPMLREWMDNNLPPMVERIVQKELEKLARQVLDE